jgi:acyl-CoA dehydrogenase
MIIFGQGALRCHPYAFQEMEAARGNDLKTFDRLFFKHLGLVASNVTRSLLLSLTGSKLARSPVSGPAARHYQRFSQLSASFAVASEMAMGTLGGALKRKEKITGRLADALAWLYIGSACLKRFDQEGSRSADEALLHWSCETAAHRVQEALHGVVQNLPNRLAANVLRLVAFPLGRRMHAPSDRLGGRIVRSVLEDPDLRDRLTAGIYLPPRDLPGLGALDRGYDLLRAAADPRAKLKAAVRDGRLKRAREDKLVEQAEKDGVLNKDEADAVRALQEAREDLIQVDSFDPVAYQARCKT